MEMSGWRSRTKGRSTKTDEDEEGRAINDEPHNYDFCSGRARAWITDKHSTVQQHVSNAINIQRMIAWGRRSVRQVGGCSTFACLSRKAGSAIEIKQPMNGMKADDAVRQRKRKEEEEKEEEAYCHQLERRSNCNHTQHHHHIHRPTEFEERKRELLLSREHDDIRRIESNHFFRVFLQQLW